MYNTEMAKVEGAIRHNHRRILDGTIHLTQRERDEIDVLCRKRRARLEIKTPDDNAWSTLKVLDLGEHEASTRLRLRQIWYDWHTMFPDGTHWRIRYDVF